MLLKVPPKPILYKPTLTKSILYICSMPDMNKIVGKRIKMKRIETTN
jgi:hypothetical protein